MVGVSKRTAWSPETASTRAGPPSRTLFRSTAACMTRRPRGSVYTLSNASGVPVKRARTSRASESGVGAPAIARVDSFWNDVDCAVATQTGAALRAKAAAIWHNRAGASWTTVLDTTYSWLAVGGG